MEIRGGYVKKTRSVVLGQTFEECFSLYVGSPGNVAVRYSDGTTDTLVGLQGGIFYPLRVITVLTTGTTVPVGDLRRGY
jgi:hypothetical protein